MIGRIPDYSIEGRRRALHWSLGDLADRAGISVSLLRDIENGIAADHLGAMAACQDALSAEEGRLDEIAARIAKFKEEGS